MGRQALEDIKSTDNTLRADCSTAVGPSVMRMVQLDCDWAASHPHIHSCKRQETSHLRGRPSCQVHMQWRRLWVH